MKLRRKPADVERLARRDVSAWLSAEDVAHVERLCAVFDAPAREELTALTPNGANQYLADAYSRSCPELTRTAISNIIRHRRHAALRAAGFDPWATTAPGNTW